ncbi:hypothetical protein KUCAC02_015803, partial [Chaenocephalus aceratus]
TLVGPLRGHLLRHPEDERSALTVQRETQCINSGGHMTSCPGDLSERGLQLSEQQLVPRPSGPPGHRLLPATCPPPGTHTRPQPPHSTVGKYASPIQGLLCCMGVVGEAGNRSCFTVRRKTKKGKKMEEKPAVSPFKLSVSTPPSFLLLRRRLPRPQHSPSSAHNVTASNTLLLSEEIVVLRPESGDALE